MLDATDADTLLAQANRLLETNHPNEAVKLLQQAIAADPRHAMAYARLGEVAYMHHEYAVAEQCFIAALERDSSLFRVANNLAILYLRSGRWEAVIKLISPIVEQSPDFAPAWFNLGCAQLRLNQYEAAVRSFEAALRNQPNYPNVMTNLARVYRLMLRHEEALQLLRKSAAIDRSPLAMSNLIFSAMFSPSVKPRNIVDLARQWDVQFGSSTTVEIEFASSLEPARRLRVGYVGPTFRNHTIGWLVEPILERHDRGQFDVFCYSDVEQPDSTTDRIRGLHLTFRETVKLDDRRLAQQIRDDRIDILIDLNLHMSSSRLCVFAARAAPVQVNYLAYPFTSGVKAMDYRITDEVLDPPSSSSGGPEELIRLKHCFWIYRPDSNAPAPVESIPCGTGSGVTFGNLNDPRKLNDEVIATWSQILQRVSNSRLMLLADEPSQQRCYFQRWFASHGIDSSRLSVVGKLPHAEHLSRYRLVDLCLDPFPYGGHTTSLDSLWMGVPTVTLVGEGPYTRGAASILSRVGLEKLVTSTTRQYIDLAVELATNRPQLASVRDGLRERMLHSDLCDERGFVQEFEASLRGSWESYCRSKQ